jgi:hypothetical protein
MLNITMILGQMLNRLTRDGEGKLGPMWEDDPLSHPALQRMSLEELADLPFDRGPVHLDGPCGYRRESDSHEAADPKCPLGETRRTRRLAPGSRSASRRSFRLKSLPTRCVSR